MKKGKMRSMCKHLKRYYWLYIFLIPALLNIYLFKLRPMYGLQIAFRDYSIVKGIWDSEWDNTRKCYGKNC